MTAYGDNPVVLRPVSIPGQGFSTSPGSSVAVSRSLPAGTRVPSRSFVPITLPTSVPVALSSPRRSQIVSSFQHSPASVVRHDLQDQLRYGQTGQGTVDALSATLLSDLPPISPRSVSPMWEVTTPPVATYQGTLAQQSAPMVLPQVPMLPVGLGESPFASQSAAEQMPVSASTEAHAKKFPSDPDVFGPGTWFNIHLLGIEATTPEKIRQYIDYIRLVTSRLPCGDCRVHATKYVEMSPPEHFVDIVDSNGKPIGMFKWSWMFHNTVNNRLGKSIVDWDTAYNMYQETDGSEGVCPIGCGK